MSGVRIYTEQTTKRSEWCQNICFGRNINSSEKSDFARMLVPSWSKSGRYKAVFFKAQTIEQLVYGIFINLIIKEVICTDKTNKKNKKIRRLSSSKLVSSWVENSGGKLSSTRKTSHGSTLYGRLIINMHYLATERFDHYGGKLSSNYYLVINIRPHA